MSEQQTNTKKHDKKIYKRWWFWVAIGLLLVIVWALSPPSTDPKLLNVAEGEQLSVSGVISGIAQSAVDGTGEITNFDCRLLSDIAIRNGGDFYSDDVCEPGTSGFIARKTDSAQSTTIVMYSDAATGNSILNCKTPTATFTLDKEGTEIISYTFEEKECFQGAKLPISNVDVKTVDELSKYADEHQYKSE